MSKLEIQSTHYDSKSQLLLAFLSSMCNNSIATYVALARRHLQRSPCPHLGQGDTGTIREHLGTRSGPATWRVPQIKLFFGEGHGMGTRPISTLSNSHDLTLSPSLSLSIYTYICIYMYNVHIYQYITM